MEKYEYAVLGSFAVGQTTYGGQTMKTRNFTDALEGEIGKEKVCRIDTHNWKKNPIRLIMNIRKALKSSKELVILPADRGIMIIPRVALLINKRFGKKIKYVVIGGWLPNILNNNNKLQNTLKKLDRIYVETACMKKKMENMDFSNISVMPNFKQIKVLEEHNLVFRNEEPFPLCTFSRVLKEKGIEDAVRMVELANEILGKNVYRLDIYGKIDEDQREWFANLKKNFSNNINYKGYVNGFSSTEIIRNYFLLLFPTYYSGEGYPGTLIDAFSAGVPVMVSDWAYNSEIVNDEVGYVLETHNIELWAEKLVEIANNTMLVNSLKCNCLRYAKKMKPESVIKMFFNA